MKKLLFFLAAGLCFFSCSGSKTMELILKENIEPVYPFDAKQKGIEGEVEIIFAVNKNGLVEKISLFKSSGYKILDDAAIDYSKELKFEPPALDKEQNYVWTKWMVKYKLDKVRIENGKIKILVLTKTNGFRHKSIDAGITSLKKLAEENNFEVIFTEDSTFFTDKNLAEINVIIFLNTTGNILDKNGEKALEIFMKNNGGFVGIHSAADTEYKWSWYGKLIGTYFKSHPEIQKAVIKVIDKNHPSTKHLPDEWRRTDEWYNFSKPLAADIKVLALIDESTYKGGENGLSHPFSWYHEFGGGRCWYTAGGHTKESYSDPLFLKHILGGIKYAAGME